MSTFFKNNQEENLTIDTPEKFKTYTSYKLKINNNNDLERHKETQVTERRIAELENEKEKANNELLAKVGYVGKLFGSSENGKINFLGVFAVLLVICAGISAYYNNINLVERIIPIVTLIIGYITGQR